MSVGFRINDPKCGAICMNLPPIPSLEDGHHLIKVEFERRYNAIPKTIGEGASSPATGSGGVRMHRFYKAVEAQTIV